jgi:hypothetical protein
VDEAIAGLGDASLSSTSWCCATTESTFRRPTVVISRGIPERTHGVHRTHPGGVRRRAATAPHSPMTSPGTAASMYRG